MTTAFWFRFWYTDLSEDTGRPWYATHLEIGIKPNGNPKKEYRRLTSNLLFWRLALLVGSVGGWFSTKELHDN